LSIGSSSTSTPRRRLTADARREVIERAATEVFADRGYHGASMEEIARRSGISVPVLYDHFESKQQLHRRLLERHFAELRALWQEHSSAEGPPAERLARAVDSWFAYVESHPYAWRMLFRDTTGDPEVEAIRAGVAERSRAALLPMLSRQPGVENLSGAAADAVEMVWEVFRGVLQGLALWWYDHRDVPRAQVVTTAMNALWVGFERVQAGESWSA
jgi:AcrR family transcriptional regulator